MSGDIGSVLGSEETEASEAGSEGLALTRRQWLLVAGGALLVVGGVGAGVFLGSRSVSRAGLLAVAALALILGAWGGYTRLDTGVSLRRPPAVSRRAGVERIGSDLEAAIRDAEAGDDRERAAGRLRVKRRLTTLATAVIADRDGCSEAEARERLTDGSWTDDETAAALFTENDTDSRLVRLLARRPSVLASARRAVGELAPSVIGAIEAPGLGPDDEPSAANRRRWRAERRQTGRWRGVGALGLATLAIAVFSYRPALVLVAAILLGAAGYARLGVAPQPTLAVERELSETDPRPGEHVTVTVTVENGSQTFLPDLRVVDDVPPDLRVVDGSAAHGTALRPGGTATFAYDVLAVYGDHDFGRVYTITRDASGHHERTGTVGDGDRTLTCEPRTVQQSVPLHPQTSGVVGRVTSDVGGSGHEFHSVREFRRGDPLRRVDWNRAARTGELATLQFREEHAATVVVLVDTRAAAFRAPDADALSAVDRSLTGAAQVYASLLSDGDRVGLANVGLEWTWVAPGAGGDHRSRVRDALKRDPNFSGVGTDETFNVDRYVRRLRRRLPSDAQLIVFSPLLDEDSATLARRLHAHGHSVTAFSPDPTATDSLGSLVARIERTRTVARVRAAGIPVVDWNQDEPLGVAVDRAERRARR